MGLETTFENSSEGLRGRKEKHRGYSLVVRQELSQVTERDDSCTVGEGRSWRMLQLSLLLSDRMLLSHSGQFTPLEVGARQVFLN